MRDTEEEVSTNTYMIIVKIMLRMMHAHVACKNEADLVGQRDVRQRRLRMGVVPGRRMDTNTHCNASGSGR